MVGCPFKEGGGGGLSAGSGAAGGGASGEGDAGGLRPGPGAVRSRRKIDAAITNARATVALRDQGGLEALIWSFRPERGPAPLTTADVPATSPESVALSKALKRAGCAHVGPTTMYALMQAIGLVDDHLAGCHARGVSTVS